MSRIVFFSINASGHTNPTLPVVKECVRRGHQVWYYSFAEFQQRIEAAGARFIGCDAFLPPPPKGLEKRVGKDFSLLISMVTNTTLNLQQTVLNELEQFAPHCIVADSMALWGKLFAGRLDLPYISSTTTFAFNQASSRIMERRFFEVFYMIAGMPRMQKDIKRLQQNGYPVRSLLDIIESKNNVNAIVYTSKEFQPAAEAFSPGYAFVGPSLAPPSKPPITKERPLLYISLGTVLHQQADFYRACFAAFAHEDMDVLLAAGVHTDIPALGPIPANFRVEHYVNQPAVLQNTDAFITHCGMNSASEAIYYGVPTVLYPLQGEEAGVATRMEQLGLGVRLKKAKPSLLQAAVQAVLADPGYKTRNQAIADSFRQAGGFAKAADKIEQVAAEAAL